MNDVIEEIEEKVLIRLLLQRQPGARSSLEGLRRYFAGKSGRGAFAPIKGGRCGACNLSVATARLQRARSGVFISCANCVRFLYCPETVLEEDEAVQSEKS